MAQRESELKRWNRRAMISDSSSEGSDSTVKANPQPDPQYLYYRLYTVDIGLPSKQPASPGNSYLGRVTVRSVTPPYTVLLIKRRLCKVEGIVDYPGSNLFLSKSCKSPMDDGERLSLVTSGCAGSTPEEPVELVVRLSPSEIVAIGELGVDPMSRYIYYRLYTEDGEMPAKHPVGTDADDTSLARIGNNLVSPPHTVNSIIRCISHYEEFSYNFWHQLFVDNTSELPIKYSDVLSLTSGSPGSTPERPLMFVQSAEMSHRMIGERGNSEPELLAHNWYEVLYTDKVVRRVKLTTRGSMEPAYHNVYRARNTAGQHGFVKADVVSFRNNNKRRVF